MEKIVLWVDDERKIPFEYNCVVRDYDNAIKLIDKQWENIRHISLDHDLGEAKTGYDIACWIEKEVAIGRYAPFSIAVHSANPVGAKKIMSAIDNINRMIGI